MGYENSTEEPHEKETGAGTEEQERALDGELYWLTNTANGTGTLEEFIMPRPATGQCGLHILPPVPEINERDDDGMDHDTILATYHCHPANKVILSTARVLIHSGNSVVSARAVFDTGSVISFINEGLVTRLGLRIQESSTSVRSIRNVPIARNADLVQLILSPHFDSYVTFSVNTYLIPRITGYVPPTEARTIVNAHLSDVIPADPQIDTPDPIEILLGGDCLPFLMQGGLIRIADSLIAQETKFGWTLLGSP